MHSMLRIVLYFLFKSIKYVEYLTIIFFVDFPFIRGSSSIRCHSIDYLLEHNTEPFFFGEYEIRDDVHDEKQKEDKETILH